MPLPSLLLPPTSSGADPGLAGRLALLLRGARAAFLFLGSWRTPTPLAAPPLGPFPEHLLASLERNLLDAGLSLGRGGAPPSPPDLALLPSGIAVLPLSVPLLHPDLLVEIGRAAAEASRPGDGAFVAAQGFVASARGNESARRRFDDEVLRLFFEGRGHQLPNLDPEVWVAARPDQDLAHLFVLLGSAGGTSPGRLLARWSEPKGTAVVLYLEPEDKALTMIPLRPVDEGA